MSSSLATCPYEPCDETLAGRMEGAICACGLKLTLRECRVCGAENRAVAGFCRRCRSELEHDAAGAGNGGLSAGLTFAPVRYAAMPGVYRRPPLQAFGSLFAVNSDGELKTMSLRESAACRTLARLPAGVGGNRAVVVEVPVLGRMRPGWTFLGVHPGGVEAVVLNTGETRTLYEAKAGMELAVNAAGSSSAFCAVASDSDVFAFAERSSLPAVTLAVRSLVDDRPAESPLTLEGRDVIGPVLHDGLLALCTQVEIGVYDLEGQHAQKVRLPRNFEPLLARRQDSLNVPPGSVPLTATRMLGGVAAHVAGSQDGIAGVVTLEFASGANSFEPLGRSGAVSSSGDGGLCVAAEKELNLMGGGRVPGVSVWKERLRLQPGMPAGAGDGMLLGFEEEYRPGAHRLTVIAAGRGKVAELAFDDAICTAVTCAAPVLTEGGAAVTYFDPAGAGGPGIKVAFWNFQHS